MLEIEAQLSKICVAIDASKCMFVCHAFVSTEYCHQV